jgi:hypothetical protein
MRLIGTLGVMVSAAAGVLAEPALGQCEPEWLPGAFGQFGAYGTDQPVDAATIWYPPGSNVPRLVIGGRFTTVAGGSFGHLAAWDGTAWYAFGAGMNGDVKGLAVFNGELVATGSFTVAGTTAASNIARWDGAAWRAMGTGLNGAGQTLVSYNGQLHVGGAFTSAGGVANTSHVARWTGSAWQALGVGTSGPVNALEVYNGELVVGGAFLNAGGVQRPYAARWNGSSWAGFPLAPSGEVYALRVKPAENLLYVGGNFTGYWMLRWNGSNWAFLAPGQTGPVRALENYGNQLVIGGDFTGPGGWRNLAAFDGTIWSELFFNQHPGSVSCLAVEQDSLFVGGGFAAIGNLPAAANLAQFSGNPVGSWSLVRPGPNAPVRALLPAGSGLYAAGDFEFTLDSTTTAHHMVSTNGASLSAVTNLATAPNGTNGPVRAMCFYSTNPTTSARLIAAGTFTQAGGLNAANIAQFSLSGWAAMGTGMNGAVNAVAQFGSGLGARLIAAGEFTTAGGVGCNRIALWNGSWNPMGTGMAGGTGVNALAVFGGELYAGGNFSTAGGIPASDVARWNGTAWNAVSGTSFAGSINALTVFNGQLVAAGDFQSLNGPAVRAAAALSAGAWTPMHAGLPLPGEGFFPMALAVHRGELYLGGQYSITDGPGDGQSGSMVYRWNGVSWQPVSTPLSGGVFALASSGAALWAGGSFTVGNARWMPFLTRLDCRCYANCDNSASGLNVNDFICFQNAFAAGNRYADCDGSGAMDVNDFICFQNRYAGGCP